MGNNCYKQPNASLIAPVNKTYTMSEAEKACQDEEGELPSFHSLEEWMEVIQMRYAKAYHNPNVSADLTIIATETISQKKKAHQSRSGLV